MVLNKLTSKLTIQCWTGAGQRLPVVNDAAPVRRVSVLNDVLHDRCETERSSAFNAEAHGQAALRVGVNEKHALTHIRKSYAEVDGGNGSTPPFWFVMAITLH